MVFDRGSEVSLLPTRDHGLFYSAQLVSVSVMRTFLRHFLCESVDGVRGGIRRDV